MPRDLSGLTYYRPWSDAITRGPKRCENRGRPPPRNLLGAYHAVHAGLKYERGDWPMPAGFVAPPAERSPMGIVGVARILGCLDTRGAKPRIHVPDVAPEGVSLDELVQRLWLLDEDDWWAGPCGILLDEVTAFEPVPCRGARGWWRVPDVEAALVRARWKEARYAA